MTSEEAIKIIDSVMTTYGEDAIDYDEVFKAKDIAIRSLEAWEKVKKEIKQIRIHYGYIDVQGLTIIKVLEIIDRHLSEMKNEIKNGVALPDNITNGDVIKAIFPNLEQDKERLIQQYGSQSLYDTYEKWCSLPYKER